MNRREFARFAAFGAASVCLPGLSACGGTRSEGTGDPAGGDSPLAPAPGASALVSGSGQRVFVDNGASFELAPLRNGIDVLDAAGDVLARIGDASRVPTRAVGDVSAPVAAAWDADAQRLLVLERGNERIQAFGLTGDPLGVVTAVDAASDLAIDPRNRSLYVAASSTHRIQVFSASGDAVGIVGAFGMDSAGLNGPTSVALSPEGMLHVVNSGDACVKVFGADARFVGSYGASGEAEQRLVGPRTIRFDRAGRAWVADTFAAAVVVFDATGSFLTRIATRLADGRPAAPVALCPRPDGTMYAAVVAAA